MRAKQLPKIITYKGVEMWCGSPNDMGFPIVTGFSNSRHSTRQTYGQYDTWQEMYEAAYQYHKSTKNQKEVA